MAEGSNLKAALAVFWSFFGVRKRRDYDADAPKPDAGAGHHRGTDWRCGFRVDDIAVGISGGAVRELTGLRNKKEGMK